MISSRVLSVFALSAASQVFQPVASFAPRPGFVHVVAASKPTVSTALCGSALESLADMTTLSIDSGDLDVIEEFAKTGFITDATTNPLFVSQAGSKGDARYEAMVQDAITYAKEEMCTLDGCENPPEVVALVIDKLAVNLGCQIAAIVPGRVSTEVDIRLSYDTEASVDRAKRIIKMYEELGVDRSRVLIKLAGTWEGIQAAGILEKEGIQCNITLVFSFLQAAAAAQAGAYLISPFPGRILDWHKQKSGQEGYEPDADPGVISVKRMYGYFRKYGYKTICMPASWRPSRGASVEGSDVDEILALAGVDEMTIPAPLLESLSALPADAVVRNCEPDSSAAVCNDPDFKLNNESWEQYWSTDACGQDKLKEGIDAFTKETEKLADIIVSKF